MSPGNSAGRKLMIEYTMLRDINDTEEDAARLADLTADLACKVNLITFNPHQGTRFQPSPMEQVLAFRCVMLLLAGRLMGAACFVWLLLLVLRVHRHACSPVAGALHATDATSHWPHIQSSSQFSSVQHPVVLASCPLPLLTPCCPPPCPQVRAHQGWPRVHHQGQQGR